MSSPPSSYRVSFSRFAASLLTLAMFAAMPTASAEEAVKEGIPEPLGIEVYQNLFEAPPFRRLLSVSDRLVLSGVAQLPEVAMVTVLNPETRESFVVSETMNPRGWRLVNLVNDPDLLKVSATISAGGREIILRFDPNRLRPRSSRNRSQPGQGEDAQVVVEALLRRLDPAAAASFEALPPRDQEDFRSQFATYLKTYPESSEANKADFVRETLGVFEPESQAPVPGGAEGTVEAPPQPDGNPQPSSQ